MILLTKRGVQAESEQVTSGLELASVGWSSALWLLAAGGGGCATPFGSLACLQIARWSGEPPHTRT